MLALTRKPGESIIVDGNIEITIVEVKGEQVRIGINAPKSVSIIRKEIIEEVQSENKLASRSKNESLDELNTLFINKVPIDRKK